MSKSPLILPRSVCGRAALLAFVASMVSSCDPDPRFDSGCPSGTAGCPCLPEGSCEDGEGECLEDLCVQAPVDEPIPPQDHGGDWGAGGAGGAGGRRSND